MADIVLSFRSKENVQIPPIPLPDALTMLTAAALSVSVLEISWNDPGLFAASYELDYSNDPLFMSVVLSTIPGLPMSLGVHNLTGLTLKAADHYVRIRAVNASGYSAYTYVNFPVPVPDQLTAFAINVSSTTQINLSWTDPGIWAVDHEIQYSTTFAFTSFTTITQAAAPSSGVNINGLTPSTTYFFRVRAKNGAIASAFIGGSGTTL